MTEIRKWETDSNNVRIFENEKIQKIYDAGKSCAKAVSGFGIGILFGAFTQTFMPEVGIPVKAAVWLGTKVFTGLVTDRTDNYIDKYCDDMACTVQEVLKEVDSEDGDREA